MINTFLLLAATSFIYSAVVVMVFLTSKRLSRVMSLHNTKKERLLFMAGLTLFLFVLLFVLPIYLSVLIAPVIYMSSLIFLLFPLVFLSLIWIGAKSPAWLQRKLNNRWRYRRLPHFGSIDLERLLSPINSFRSLSLWFLLLGLIPYAIRGTIMLLLTGKTVTNPDIALLLSQVALNGLYVPIVEETFFKWLPFSFGGPIGLSLGVLFWFIFHPIQLLLKGEAIFIICITTVIWALQVPLYIKIWRGKYFWAAFLVHTATNCALIIVSSLWGVPS